MVVPVAIGARGTIGSLVSKEMECSSKFESDKRCSSRKTQARLVHVPRTGCDQLRPRPEKTKKPRGGTTSCCGFLPSICSMVKAVETSRLGRIITPGYNYRVLKDRDSQNLLL